MKKQLFWVLVALTIFVGFLVHKDPTAAQTEIGAFAGGSPGAPTAAFTSGNLVVYRVGDGVGTLINTGNPVFLDEYTTSGTLVQSIAVPTAASGSNKPCISGGTSTSEGLLNRSTDGNYLVFTGYATTTGGATSLSSTTAATVNRCVGRADASGNIDTSTALTDFASGSSPRSAITDNGTNLWVTGGAGGVRNTSLGLTTSTQLSTTVTNLRDVNIYGGQLYVSDSSGTAVRIGAVGSGTPTTSGQTIVNLPGFRIDGSPYQFVLLDLNAGVAGVDTLYYAEDGASSGGSQPAGVYKYSLVGGSWTANGMVSVTGAVGLTASASGSTVNIFVTNGSTLQTIADTTGYNATITAAPTTIVTAGANTALRGVAFAPGAAGTPTPTPTATPTPTPAPVVTSVSPTSGTTAGGTSVTITGINFTGATGVTFGGTAATTFIVNSATSITATSPAHSAGIADVIVTTPGGASAISASDQFTYVAPPTPTPTPAPAVTSVSPTSGPSTGGTSVAITGTNFTGATSVSFGGTAAAGFTVNSATSITATSPAHAAGLVDITVTTSGGTSATSAADQFTFTAPTPTPTPVPTPTPAPSVTSVSPTSGSTAGGTSVSITGTNFTGTTGVSFGGTAATTFTVNSATSVTATSPAHAAGTVDITVTTSGGTSATSANDQFTYTTAPTPTPTPGKPQHVVDFDGDKKTDFSVIRDNGPTVPNTWWNLSSQNGTLRNADFGNEVTLGDHEVPADYDGDGKTDVAMWRPPQGGDDALWFVLHSLDGTATVTQFGSGEDDPSVVGDYDGDGKADYATYRADLNTGLATWWFRPSSGPLAGQNVAFQWGSAPNVDDIDIPVPGDYNGDGIADMAVARASANGQAYIWLHLGNGTSIDNANTTVTPWGHFATGDRLNVDQFVPGDYDGDGITDLAIARTVGAQTEWWVRFSTDQSIHVVDWGAFDDLPVQGDYDGDGRTDIATWRPSDGTFYVLGSATGTPIIKQWGNAATDVPTANYNTHF